MPTEREVQATIIDAARTFGWRVAAFRPAQTKHGWRTPVQGDGKGWPDLHLSKVGHGVYYRELKAPTGKLTDDQQAWGDHLIACGQDWAVWYTNELDAIIQFLSHGTARIA
jgi:hypothetical protein